MLKYLEKFNHRSDKLELLDTLDFNTDTLIKNLNEFESINRWLGSHTLLINGLNQIYNRSQAYGYHWQTQQPITIADLGCGGGDLCRVIYHWAKKKQLPIELTGIDINPEIVQQAKQRSISYPSIHYQAYDIFSDDFKTKNFDIVCLNNICHHFNDERLVLLIQLLLKQTKLAILINDLHRHPLAYYGIFALSRLFNLSSLAKHDGPLSVLRAFRHQELLNILAASGARNFKITWKWAFRWQIIVGAQIRVYK